jgi:glycosyltransferase involved in cell wall biosynthesis
MGKKTSVNRASQGIQEGSLVERKIILQFSGMSCFKYGALEHYFINLIRDCNLKGYKTVIQYEESPSSIPYRNDLEALDARIVPMATHSSPLKCLVTCFSLIADHRPEVIHIHFVSKFAKLFVPLIARLFRVRTVVCTVHNKPGYTTPHPSRLAYNLYNAVLPVSRAVAGDLIIGGVNPGIIHPLYLGLFGERERDSNYGVTLRRGLGIPETATVLGCIAFEAGFKGVDILLQAFKLILETRNDVYLIEIGVSLESTELIDMAVELGIDEHVRWMGVIDQGWRALCAADIYIQPSRSEEGLPLSIMEAMSMKLPVVATRVSGNAEAIIDGETGILTDNTPEDLARGISAMLTTPSRWDDYAQAGYRRYKEQFDGVRSLEALVRDYYNLL